MERGEMIGRGETAEVFVWEDGKVLKLFLEEFPFTEAGDEARITEAAHKAGLPVPAVNGVVKVDSRAGVVFERLEGPILTTALLSRPWRFFKLANMMEELHAAIHSCELPGLPSQREEFEEAIRERAPLPNDVKEGLLKILERLPDGNTLCHNDFHPENIIMTARGPIIIDWWTAKRGNPLADAAITSLLLRVSAPQDRKAVLKWLLNMGGSLVYSIYSREYTRLRSVSRTEIDAWLPVAAAHRLAMGNPKEKRQLLAIIEAGLKG